MIRKQKIKLNTIELIGLNFHAKFGGKESVKSYLSGILRERVS